MARPVSPAICDESADASARSDLPPYERPLTTDEVRRAGANASAPRLRKLTAASGLTPANTFRPERRMWPPYVEAMRGLAGALGVDPEWLRRPITRARYVGGGSGP